MRTSITHKEMQEFTFPMTDRDILKRVDEVNELISQEGQLNVKKQLIQKEIKQLQADQSFKLRCISRKEEPREVECDIIFDYQDKTIKTYFEGEEMASRRMSDWEYSTRPDDVFPEIRKAKSETSTQKEGSLQTAVDRAVEIAEKTSGMQAVSGDVREKTEANTETAIEAIR